MFDRYPTFASLFEPPPGNTVPRHLKLLNLPLPSAAEAVGTVRTAARRSSRLEDELLALLDELNWRPNLVATTAIAPGYGAEAAVDGLWRTFDRGSWVTPQLAVAASLRDPEFEPKAQSRIESWRSPSSGWQAPTPPNAPSGWRTSKTLSALISLFDSWRSPKSRCLEAEMYSALVGRAHPKYLSGWLDPKALSALIYLCSLRPSCRPWLADLTTVAYIEEALAYDRRFEQGDQLAKGWLEQITKVMREP